MRAFSLLYTAIDESNRTNDKVAAMASYFSSANAEDAAWAVYFLIGRRPKRLLSGPKLWGWAAECASLPAWLFAECYEAVGDLAETISLVLPEPTELGNDRAGLSHWVKNRLLPLATMDEETQRHELVQIWSELTQPEKFVFNKLITGSFRVGVSSELVNRALSQISGVEKSIIAHRLMGDWEPGEEFFRRLVSEVTSDAATSQPYPFCLAHPLEGEIEHLGAPQSWQIEWKWDGIRAQLVRRAGKSYIWSRGEELITDRFPEVLGICESLPPGTVLDGEILAWRDGKPLKFMELQKRIGRKNLTKKIMNEVPVSLVVFDLLEDGGEDIRLLPLGERRARLERLVEMLNHPGSSLFPEGQAHFDKPLQVDERLASFENRVESRLLLAPTIEEASWEEIGKRREASRELNVEGFMIKSKSAAYLAGRKRGTWWKWKIDPFTVDAVLIYAQAGSGRRASLFTDYTFGIWSEGALVPFAKAYSGLSDEEIRRVDSFVRKNTLEKFGPVRTVKPELVMELAFEGIQLSSRHKSGIAVRFPRISKWRFDKKAEDADTLDAVKAMI